MDPKTLAELVRFGVITEAQAQLLSDLAKLTGDELVALQTSIADLAQAVDAQAADDDDIALLTVAASAAQAIKVEFDSRRADAEASRTLVADLQRAVLAAAGADDAPNPMTPAPVGSRPSIGRLAQRRPASHRPFARHPGAQVLTASGEPASEDLAAIVGRALGRELRDRGRHTGPAKKTLVASVRADYPQDRQLGEDEVLNARRVAAVTSPAALTASGGVCSPVGVTYDVQTVAVADRPVRDALAQFAAARGGVRYTTPHTLAQVTADGPSVVWTAANDANPTSPTTKPTATLTCSTVQEALVDAVTSQVKLSNFQGRYFPEQVAEYLATALGVHARLAEATLLAAMTTGSTVVNSGFNLLGAAAEVLAEVDRAAAGMRFRHRMAADAPLRLIIPEWLEDMIRADLAREAPGNSGGQSERLAVADAEIDRWFAVRNINVTDALDSPTGASPFQGFVTQGAGDLLPWPSKVTVWLYPEGSWLFLDGGTLDLGIVRDSTLNRTNDLTTFSETFEKAIFVGHESLALTLETCVSGQRANLADTASLCISGS